MPTLRPSGSTSRRRLRLAALAGGVAAAAVTVALVVTASPPAPAAAAPPPNIVVLVLDDLNHAMFRQAASLRRGSVSEGLTFSNAVASTPLCCPARSTLLTGRYAHNHGVHSNGYTRSDGKPGHGGERRFLEQGNERRTVAYHLQKGGYSTALIGKYMNGYGFSDGGPDRDPEFPPNEPDEDGSYKTRVPPGWSAWHAFAGSGMNDNGRFACFTRPCVSRPTADGVHRTDQIKRRALDFVRAQNGPFFLYLADQAPHNEVPPPDRYSRTHDGATPPRTPSLNEEDVSDKPGYIRRDFKLTPPGKRPKHCPSSDWPIAYPTSDHACYASADYSRNVWELGLEGLEGVNDLYDSVVTELARRGQLANTYIFLVSDNGLHLGEHRQSYGKNTPYVEDLKVPFVVRGPRTPRNVAVPHLVGLQDVAPTVLDLAGVPAPGSMDGRSLRPFLTGTTPPPSAWRKRIGIEGWGDADPNKPHSARSDTPPWRGVLDATRRYTQYATGERELYRLPRDPYELENQAGSARGSELASLRRLTEALRRCRGTSCRAAENR